MIQHTRKEQGTAILAALFVMVLASLMAYFMLERLSILTRSTTLIIHHQTKELYVNGMIAWAKDELNNSQKTTLQRFPIESPPAHEKEYFIQSTLYDAEGYFNLNNITHPDYPSELTHLIQVISPDLPLDQIQHIVLGIMDWIKPTQDSVLDHYYEKQRPPYRAPHRPMVSVSELRLVKGMTPLLYQQLLPYVIALPSETPFNINAISTPVLMSLFPNISLDVATTIIQHRDQVPFTTLQAFLSLPPIKTHPIAENELTLQSRFFLLKTSVTEHDETLIFYTLLEHNTEKKSTHILWQSEGTL